MDIDIVIGSDFNWNLFNGYVIKANEGLVSMEKCQGWALSGHVATCTNKNAVQNVFKIATAQIETLQTEHFTWLRKISNPLLSQ